MFNRREFLKISALSACSLYISTSFTGCGNDDACDDCVEVAFYHGVASGDPLADRVILWTRATPLGDFDESKSFKVQLEVAEDEAFTKMVRTESLTASKVTDYTIKVDLQDLQAGKVYYYRFRGKNSVSDIGKTKTLPTGNIDKVKMAVFTCANYPNGYFNAYTEAAKIEDLDVTVHVGDYIYEYGMYAEDDGVTPAYATKNAHKIDRVLPADNYKECIKLDDYRKRYALYHTDKGTQAIHKAAPMIVVWDDHEVANDSYKDGASNHQSDEGDFTTRTKEALQAYFEWLPIRPITDKKKIFRSFDFGNLVTLHMLETRLFGRDKQLNYADYYNQEGQFDAATFVSDVSSNTRTMLGNEQLVWLQGQLQTSTATWQVLGQQVLMGKMNLPAEILTPIAQLEYASEEQKSALMTQINTSLSQLAQIKMKKLQGETLTAQEEQRISTVMPYNLDAWDGYQFEREVIYATIKALDKNLIVLAGDTHNAWANNLKDKDGNQIGVELATTSVTSPGLEDYLGLPDVASSIEFEGVLKLLIDDLEYVNTYDRGYMVVEFTPEQTVSKWYFVDNYNSTYYGMQGSRFKSLKVKTGLEGRKIEEI